MCQNATTSIDSDSKIVTRALIWVWICTKIAREAWAFAVAPAGSFARRRPRVIGFHFIAHSDSKDCRNIFVLSEKCVVFNKNLKFSLYKTPPLWWENLKIYLQQALLSPVWIQLQQLPHFRHMQHPRLLNSPSYLFDGRQPAAIEGNQQETTTSERRDTKYLGTKHYNILFNTSPKIQISTLRSMVLETGRTVVSTEFKLSSSVGTWWELVAPPFVVFKTCSSIPSSSLKPLTYYGVLFYQ